MLQCLLTSNTVLKGNRLLYSRILQTRRTSRLRSTNGKETTKRNVRDVDLNVHEQRVIPNGHCVAGHYILYCVMCSIMLHVCCSNVTVVAQLQRRLRNKFENHQVLDQLLSKLHIPRITNVLSRLRINTGSARWIPSKTHIHPTIRARLHNFSPQAHRPANGTALPCSIARQHSLTPTGQASCMSHDLSL